MRACGVLRESVSFLDALRQRLRACGVSRETVSFLDASRNEGLWSLEGIFFLCGCLEARDEGLWSLEGNCLLFRYPRQGMRACGVSRESVSFLHAPKEGMRACGVSKETVSFLNKARNEGLWSLEGICFLFRCLKAMNDQPASFLNIEGSGWIGWTKAFAS